MTEKTVYLGLGSNLGNPVQTLKDAFEQLKKILSNAEIASFYRTDPQDVTDQPQFINTAVRGMTGLSAYDLLSEINRIEAEYGRNRENEIRRGPRTLDIDILLYGNDLIIDPPVLVIPHERLHLRKFALVPLLELNPEIKQPGTNVLYSTFIEGLSEQGIYCF